MADQLQQQAERSEVHGPPLETWSTPSWTALLLDSVRKYPDNLAVAALHQAPTLYGITSLPPPQPEEQPYLRWSFRDLERAVSRLAAGLKASGVRKGAPVFTFLVNGIESLLVLYAAKRIGAVLVPFNPRALTNEAEIRHMVGTALEATGRDHPTPVVFATTEDLANRIDDMKLVEGARRFIVAPETATSPQFWTTFDTLMSIYSPKPSHLVTRTEQDRHKTIDEEAIDDVILFTSGSSSLPKGCHHRHENRAYKATFMNRRNYQDNQQAGKSAFCCAVPNNHAIGHLWPQSFLGLGAAVVYPGPAFDPEQVLRAMTRERVTHTTLIPTMVHALAGELRLRQPQQQQGVSRPDNLVSIMLAGASVSPEALRTCTDVLGSRGAENFFGMTEGILICGGSQRNHDVMREDDRVAIGFVQPGDALRVVDPETGAVVPRGVWGELHVSGPGIRRYLGGRGAEDFYEEDVEADGEGGKESRLWFKTGDRVKMDSKGRVFHDGRLKEMIIRGGENMAPAAIETAIRKSPLLDRLTPIVVGSPDTLAGEVPVAVVGGGRRTVDAETRRLVREAVLRHMGDPMYVPDQVLSAHQLGLSDAEFAASGGGKVPRRIITAAVAKYRAREARENQEREAAEGRRRSVDEDSGSDSPVTTASASVSASSSGSLYAASSSTSLSSAYSAASPRAAEPDKAAWASAAATLTDIWARATGIEQAQLSLDTPVRELGADSISLMRVRDTLCRRTGMYLSVSDLTRAETIGDQVKLLLPAYPPQSASPAAQVQSQSQQEHKTQKELDPSRTSAAPERAGPPAMHDIEFVHDDPALFAETKALVEGTIAEHGLGWEDVKDVFPSYDYAQILTETGLMDALQWWFSYVSKTANKEQLKRALQTALANNPITVSYYVRDESRSVLDGDYFHVTMRPSDKMFGLMFHDGGSIGTAEEVGALTNAYPYLDKGRMPGPCVHATFYDVAETGTAGVAMSLHHAVHDGSFYQILAEDLDLALDAELKATTSIPEPLRPHVSYKMWTEAYYNQRTSARARAATRWQVNRLRDLPRHAKALYIERLGDNSSSPVPSPSPTRAFVPPGLRELLRTHPDLSAPMVMQTALALFCVHRTGHTHAVTSSFEAARNALPFLSAGARQLPGVVAEDASDVGGPTWQRALHLTPVDRAETTLSLLGRVKDAQDELSQNSRALAPLREVATALSPHAASLLYGILQGAAPCLNWVPGLGARNGDQYRHMNLRGAVIKPFGFGVYVIAGMTGAGEMIVQLLTDALDEAGKARWAWDLERIVCWLTAEENWEAPVGRFVEALT